MTMGKAETYCFCLYPCRYWCCSQTTKQIIFTGKLKKAKDCFRKSSLLSFRISHPDVEVADR